MSKQRYSKAFLQRRLELTAKDTGWNVTGPLYEDDIPRTSRKAIVGRVFLQKAPVGNRWRVVQMITPGGGEHNITDSLSPSELVEWLGGVMWAYQHMENQLRKREGAREDTQHIFPG